MNNILVTGGKGFVGQNLVPYLQSKTNCVFVLSRNEFVNGTDKVIDSSHNAVVHLAGKAHDLKKTSNSDEYYQVNFELTKKLYDAFLQSEAQKFIFISSVKAAAEKVTGYLTEEMEPNPQTDYGKSKLLAEQYIQNQPLPPGKSFYILRPCMIHGPGNKGNLNLLYNFVKKGLPYPLTNFHNKRSFLSIENLCFVIKELIERHDVPPGVYQVADDEPLSTNELIELICKGLMKKPRLLAIPQWVIKGMANIGDKLKLPLNNERLNKLTENYIVANTKITEALNKNFPIKARDGIVATIQSFQ